MADTIINNHPNFVNRESAMTMEIRPGRSLKISIYPNSSSQKTAFLLHGLGGREDQWKEQIAVLKDHYTLIIPHLLGHGESDKPTVGFFNPYTFEEFNRDIQAIFERYQSEHNIVLGHSYGGALAAALALDHQDKINRLILIDPMPCEPATMPFIYRLPVFMLECLRPQLDKAFQQMAFDPSASPDLLARESEAGKKNKLCVIKAMLTGMKTLPVLDIKQLTVPTLIIIGEKDKVISPVRIIDFYQALSHHRFEMIKQAAHMPMLERPQEVNQLILSG